MTNRDKIEQVYSDYSRGLDNWDRLASRLRDLKHEHDDNYLNQIEEDSQ